LPVDVVLEKDVAVPLRDGVTIYVDVFRPVGAERVPVIVAWSPYGKGQGTSRSVTGIFGMVGLDNAAVSGLEKFEGPDPACWCAHGYAICNPDIRGAANCDGDSVVWDRQEGRDCHDLIEWLAEQTWCSGKVAMSGTSYLAVSQWFTAAEQPPHLAAINPWEQTPKVRYAVLDLQGGDRVAVAADEFPPEGVASTKYYLDGGSRTLSTCAPTQAAMVEYEVESNPDLVSFVTRFDEETVPVGYPKAHLWVEVRGSDDMDLFVLLQKLDVNGVPLLQFNVPNQGALAQGHHRTRRLDPALQGVRRTPARLDAATGQNLIH
jgi:predicted acyl esterase